MNSNKKIRILHVVGTRPVGGIGAMLKSINKNVDRKRFEFAFIFSGSTEKGTFDADVKMLGAETIVLPELKIKNLMKYIVSVFLFYKGRAKEFDILHVHNATIGVLDLLFAFLYGIKIRILHSHSTKYSPSKLKSIRNFIIQLPVKLLANNYFACSASAGKFLFGARNIKNVTIINNAIDVSVFKYDKKKRDNKRAELNLQEKFVLGHIGSFVEVKNHLFLLDVFGEFNKIEPESILLLVGSGKLKSNIERRVSQLGIEDNVMFLGQCRDVSSLLSAMDAFVFPSFFEGLPVSLIEAQATGLKCFVADTITQEVNVTKKVNYLSLDDSALHWAKQIFELSREYNRNSNQPNMQNSKYDIMTEVQKLETLYVNLCLSVSI